MSWHTVAVSWPPSPPYCTCAQPYRGRVMAHGSRVAGLCRDTKPCRRPLLVTIQNLYRDPSPCPARAVARVEAPSAVSQPSRVVSRPKVAPLSHDTISCIATRPLAAKPSCARGARPARRPTLSRACWPCRGPLAARSTALCHDTTYCIVTQTGKWAVAHSSSPAPFFSSFCSTYWKTKYIYIYIFHFPVEQNKFNKIYFIYFFPVLYTVKPQKKNLFNTHIFFLCAVHQAHKSHNMIHNHTSHNNHQSAQGMRDLTRAHQVLGNRIPNLLILSYTLVSDIKL